MKQSSTSNPEAEQVVIGSALLDQSVIPQIEAAGGARLMGDQVHADLMEEMIRRHTAGQIVSPVSMRGWAESNDALTPVGGAKYLVRMAGVGVSDRLIGSYLDLLSDLAAKRKLMESLSAAIQSIEDDHEPAEIIAGRLEAAMMDVSHAGSIRRPVTMFEATKNAMEETLSAMNGEMVNCVPSGIYRLDNLITGFRPGEMTLLGGRPAMGKTALALTIAANAARAGHGVAIMSLEMTPESMAMRLVSEQTSQDGCAIPYFDMRRGEIADFQRQALAKAAKTVSDLPISFLPRDFADIDAVAGGVKQAKRILGDNMKLLIVDYAQLLRSKKRTRYEQITEISTMLKILSGTEGIPILALSQLSRGLESRDDKRPMLSDLRESGQLEQDADAVIFCYRGEVYLEKEEPDPGDDAEKHEAWERAMKAARNRMEIIVSKNRHGPTGTAHVRCNMALNRVWEE